VTRDEAVATIKSARDLLYPQSRDGASPWLVSEVVGRLTAAINVLAAPPEPAPEPEARCMCGKYLMNHGDVMHEGDTGWHSRARCPHPDASGGVLAAPGKGSP
jgi:hypothetical protein